MLQAARAESAATAIKAATRVTIGIEDHTGAIGTTPAETHTALAFQITTVPAFVGGLQHGIHHFLEITAHHHSADLLSFEVGHKQKLNTTFLAFADF